jgi:hypothetical protein
MVFRSRNVRFGTEFRAIFPDFWDAVGVRTPFHAALNAKYRRTFDQVCVTMILPLHQFRTRNAVEVTARVGVYDFRATGVQHD